MFYFTNIEIKKKNITDRIDIFHEIMKINSNLTHKI